MTVATVAAMLSIGLTVLMFVLSLVFKVAGKLRLTLPVLCFLLFSTVLNRWAGEHEVLAFAILFGLLGLTVVSWVASLVKAIRRKRQEKFMMDDIAWQLQRAREKGFDTNGLSVDADGTVYDPDTGKAVI